MCRTNEKLFLERLLTANRIAVLEAENKRLRERIVELEDYEAPVNLQNMNIKALKQECCTFHSTGGDPDGSCGGDISQNADFNVLVMLLANKANILKLECCPLCGEYK